MSDASSRKQMKFTDLFRNVLRHGGRTPMGRRTDKVLINDKGVKLTFSTTESKESAWSWRVEKSKFMGHPNATSWTGTGLTFCRQRDTHSDIMQTMLLHRSIIEWSLSTGNWSPASESTCKITWCIDTVVRNWGEVCHLSYRSGDKKGSAAYSCTN